MNYTIKSTVIDILNLLSSVKKFSYKKIISEYQQENSRFDIKEISVNEIKRKLATEITNRINITEFRDIKDNSINIIGEVYIIDKKTFDSLMKELKILNSFLELDGK